MELFYIHGIVKYNNVNTRFYSVFRQKDVALIVGKRM